MRRVLIALSYLAAAFVGAWCALEVVDRLLGGHGPRLSIGAFEPDPDDEPGGGW